MKPWHHDDRTTIYHGDCIEVLRALPDASVDAVVTDPPYALNFMGKSWDDFSGVSVGACQECGGDDPAAGLKVCTDCAERLDEKALRGASMLGQQSQNWHEKATHSRGYADNNNAAFQRWCTLWSVECLRVLKPGGHLLAFGGTRTWHRLACAIEDAGFEVRDSIAWLYGSGFPKSLDVSKAIDKARDDRPDILRVTYEIARLRDLAGLTNRDLDDAFGFAGMAGHWTSTKSQPTVPRVEQWAVLRDMLNPGPWLDEEVWRLNGRKGSPGEAWQSAEVLGVDERWNEPSGIVSVGQGERERTQRLIKAPATDGAREWSGWGTALKPAHEPIVVARKPLVGTVAANVLEHGTGALNIDACRVGTSEELRRPFGTPSDHVGQLRNLPHGELNPGSPLGRWPANVVLDEDQAAELDRQSGVSRSTQGVTPALGRSGGILGAAKPRPDAGQPMGYADHGGASRFFYVAKAPARERPKVDGTAHPTVKPLTLMRWLCRLVTPPDGVILEPFAGSGTTIEAALLEGFRVVAIEREAEYLPLIQARLDRVAAIEPDDEQLTLDASA
jgi:DNA modification methylase